MRHCRKYADFAKYFADDAYVAERMNALLDRVAELDNGCHEVGGWIGGDGYAKISFGGVYWQAHRFAWIAEHGDIGELVVDHKCRNRRCVNLAHLEAVTNAENVRRGKEFAHGGKCQNGHKYTKDYRGHSHCETCRLEAMRRRYAEDSAHRERLRARNRENMRRYRSAKRAA